MGIAVGKIVVLRLALDGYVQDSGQATDRLASKGMDATRFRIELSGATLIATREVGRRQPCTVRA